MNIAIFIGIYLRLSRQLPSGKYDCAYFEQCTNRYLDQPRVEHFP